MTLFDVSRLNAHWARVPPLRILVMAVARALGVELKTQSEAPQYMTPEAARAMLALTGGRIDGVGTL
jgi:hypothetical protein